MINVKLVHAQYLQFSYHYIFLTIRHATVDFNSQKWISCHYDSFLTIHDQNYDLTTCIATYHLTGSGREAIPP